MSSGAEKSAIGDITPPEKSADDDDKTALPAEKSVKVESYPGAKAATSEKVVPGGAPDE